MKYFASLCALLLAGSVPGLASVHHVSVKSHNQFHFKPVGHRAVSAHVAPSKQLRGLAKLQTREPKVVGLAAERHSASARNVRRHTANPPTGKLGFASALDIPAGGGSWNTALAADINGDGKNDIVTVVGNYNIATNSYVYSLSAVLSNGDGTFQQPVLTAISNGDPCPAVVVGDMNGDNKADLVVAHQPGACGNSYTVPTFDVLLSNGDGTFTLNTNNTNNTVATAALAGGTLADVNGDGKLDIIVVDDNNPAQVWTLLGNGDGTFQAPTAVALSGPAGSDVVFADLNGDGFLDIADNDFNTNQVTVYLATSASAYAPGAAYATSDGNYNACSLTAGDLSGDGKPELVTANCSDSGNDVTVYVNNGDGTFATGVYYDGAMSGGTNSGAASVYTEGVTIADVNGDGKADLIASNDDSGDITVLLGNGDGTVNIPTVGYAVGGYPRTDAIVGDFNGDGLADIIVPDDEFSLVYLKGYGDGTFRSSLNYYAATTAYAYSFGMATGDFNGDGQTDFVIGNNCSSCTTPMGITVFLSRPDGSLQPGVNYGTSNSLGFVAVADFNGDGKLDIAATDYNGGVVQLFNGDGAGNFTVGSVFNTDLASNAPYGIVVGDFNKDGHPDLAIANYNGLDVAILLNDGSGNFPVPVPVALNNYTWEGLATADINGDGNLDLVLPAYYGTSVAVLLGNGDGTFQPEQDLPLGASTPANVLLADLNGDGKVDMAVTLDGGSGQDLAIALGNGDGTFGAFSILPSSLQNYNLDSPYPEYLQAADVDGDGKTDLVYANSEYGTIGVLFGQGNGTFYDPVEFPVGGYDWSLAVTDVNGDGAPDVVAAGDDFAGVTVLLNANGAATQPNFTLTAPQSSVTVTAGASAIYSLVITPSNFYNGTISFSCGTLPSETTCSFLPATLTPTGNGQWSTQLTITTTAATSAALHHTGSRMMLATLSGIGLFGLVFAGSFKKNRMGVIAATIVVVMMISLVGCGGSNNNNNGGGGNPGTPAGGYTVVVTATGNSNGTTVSHTSNLTLTVQ